MNNVINEIMTKKIGDIIVDAPLAKYTTYRVGGTCKLLVYPKNLEKLIEFLYDISAFGILLNWLIHHH